MNSRTLLKKLELDIFLSELNIAIEFNGLYWHSELFKDDKYHLYKTKQCLKHDVSLLHIWEDDWTYRSDIIKSIISSKLGLNKKIYARKCTVVKLSAKESSLFLLDNHLQGPDKASIRYGLLFDNKLVSVMTFGKARRALGGTSGMELLRFCSVLNTTVVGGASKLFKYFLDNNDTEHVFSYADMSRYSGGVYEKMGFKKSHETPPNFWYIVNGKRRHRFGYRKDVLVREGYNSDKTARSIMQDRGIIRIYDCGSIRYDFKRLNGPTSNLRYINCNG